MSQKLLSRDDFREGVFARDKHKCVFCDKPAKDAHHILERRLWGESQKGGYFLNNGASVCEEHHMKCETTEISVEDVRRACGITKPIIPDHLYGDMEYDKWGNPIMPNGTRLKGELFFDESVQIVLKKGGALDLFVPYVKYPRTHHLPWSLGLTEDDRVISSMEQFVGKRVIVTKKMDGENTSMYRDYFHARSIDGRNHESRSWAKNFHSTFQGDIPEYWRVCAENLYARHSIEYQDLKSLVLGFSIWNEYNVALSWDDTLEWFELLGITPVDVLYDGIYDEKTIKGLWNEINWDTEEGYVLRIADPIPYGEFKKYVAKFVRNNHVQTTKHHWKAQMVVPNKMAGE